MASIIKADNIQKVSDGSNIIKKCGSTITVGSSGQTVALASGASQTGFGTPTSSVLWCTTAKTSPFTAADQKGYFVNTSGGAVTVTLPASPSAGDVVALKDYGNTWDTNAVTLCRNSSKINGVCNNADLSTEAQSVTLIYVDATKGWQAIQDSTSNVTGTPLFICATGGTITTVCTNFKVHTFTSSGTFTINSAPSAPNNNVSYMVVAGGAGGGRSAGGGGGAGGFREGQTPAAPYTGSPLKNSSGLPVSVQAYTITVGAGGAGSTANPVRGANGGVSTFSTITSAGGGGGGSDASPVYSGNPGGSGGGTRANTNTSGGTGNTPPTSPAQGTNGGNTSSPPYPGCNASGGGGATAAGVNNGSGTPSPTQGDGGAGATTSINGSPNSFAGGGGGPNNNPGPAGDGGTGGGGNGGGCGQCQSAGTANTGGGGGGGTANGNAGGSGIVIIRYKFQ